MRFENMGLCTPILCALRDVGYKEPTPIQEQAIPAVLKGNDLLGCAQTGTGKTAAFSLPILNRLAMTEETKRNRRFIRALVLTPTRELALQIYENCVAYSRYLPVRCCVVFGGVSQKSQEEVLRKGVDLLIATPGRLGDLMNQGLVRLNQIEALVLDEADRMLDMGFIRDVKRILSATPPKKQTLLFSATMPKEIARLADSLLHEPVKVSVSPAATPVEVIDQRVYFTDKAKKRKLLAWILEQTGASSVLVFTRTKHGADRVARDLNRSGIQAMSIHGDKSQGARQRALTQFKEHQLRVLVATDIAARGIDIDRLELVVNFDLPEETETYVHRIGRTGRAGRSGMAVSFCDYGEMPLLRNIEKLIGKQVPEEPNHPFLMEVFTSEPQNDRPPRNRSGYGNRSKSCRGKYRR